MNTHAEPGTSGLRRLYELAQAAGGQLIDGILQLPASMGTGSIQLLAPEPGLRLAIIRCSLRQEFIIRRVADATQPERLLISCIAFAPPATNVVHPSRTGYCHRHY